MELQNEILQINGQSIACPAVSGERYVAITPVCNILGIDNSRQKRLIKEHPLFSQGVTSGGGVATDGKGREMFSLNLKYFFGWLFGIHPNKVNEENKEPLIEYQKGISDIIYEQFVLKPQFEKLKVEAKLNKIEQIEERKRDLKTIKEELKEIDSFSYDDYKSANNQTKLF